MSSRLAFLLVYSGLLPAAALRTASARGSEVKLRGSPYAKLFAAAKSKEEAIVRGSGVPVSREMPKFFSAAVAKEEALGAQMQLLLEEVGEAEAGAKAQKSVVGRPVPQPQTAPYALRRCGELFTYEENRETCLRLQKALCGRNCSRIVDSTDVNVTADCEDLQASICQVPILNKTSAPIKVENGTNGTNGTNVTTTFCNVFVSTASISIQHDKYHALADPSPFVPHLPYLSCAQAQVPPGKRVTVFLGGASMTTYTVGRESALVLLGQYNLGEQEMGVTVVAFKDEGYNRPILCSAFPVPHLAVQVYGKDWHVFSDAEHPKAIGYMECEKLSLDHADSVRHPEILDFFDGKAHRGELEIDPTKTLFLVGAMGANLTANEMLHTSYSFDHLKSTKKDHLKSAK